MQIVLHANKLETTCWINPHSTRETVMKNSVVSEGSIWGKLPISALFPIVAIIIGLLLGGMLGRLGPYALGAVIGLIIMTLITILRQDALAAVLVVVAHIYVDWYLGLLFAAQVITLLLPQYYWGSLANILVRHSDCQRCAKRPKILPNPCIPCCLARNPYYYPGADR